MDYKKLVKAGFDRIADDYLAARTSTADQLHLLDDLADRLPRNASVRAAERVYR